MNSKETIINPIVNESDYGSPPNVPNPSIFEKNYGNLNTKMVKTSIEDKKKPLFIVKKTSSTLATTSKKYKEDIDNDNIEENEKINNSVFENCIFEQNCCEEDKLLDSTKAIIGDIKENSTRNIKGKSLSFSDEEKAINLSVKYMKTKKSLEKEKQNLNELKKNPNSLSDIYLCLNKNVFLESEKSKMEIELCQMIGINPEKNKSEYIQKGFSFLSLCKKCLKPDVNQTCENLKLKYLAPKYLLRKRKRPSKFYANGIRKILTVCAKNLDISIRNLCKKYKIKIYKLNIKNIIKWSIKDLKNFFEKSIIDIYCSLLPKKCHNDFKKELKDKNPKEIQKKRQEIQGKYYEKNKKVIEKLLKAEEEDKDVKIKKLNFLFNGKTIFWDILKSFIKNTKKISNNNGNVKLAEFKTIKDIERDVLIFTNEEKNLLISRIKKIKEGRFRSREPRAKQKVKKIKFKTNIINKSD
jgi:hypothetical protein